MNREMEKGKVACNVWFKKIGEQLDLLGMDKNYMIKSKKEIVIEIQEEDKKQYLILMEDKTT